LSDIALFSHTLLAEKLRSDLESAVPKVLMERGLIVLKQAAPWIAMQKKLMTK
jgi:hypothetical protein